MEFDRNEYGVYREPIRADTDGTYLTVAQLRFFINQVDGLQAFKERSPEFIEYVNLCRVYNLVFDMMEEDEDCAIMYWDDRKKVVSLGFPADGKVAKAIATVTMRTREDWPKYKDHPYLPEQENQFYEEEDEDEWDLFKDT
jgi:hypothetical protein